MKSLNERLPGEGEVLEHEPESGPFGCRRLKLLRFAVPLGAAAVLTLMLAGVASGIGVDARVSTDAAGGQIITGSTLPAISGDGRYVAFVTSDPNLVSSDDNGTTDVFLKGSFTGTVRLVSSSLGGSEGNSQSYAPAVSADGRYVAFYSAADNLLSPAADGNLKIDVFVKDTSNGATKRASINSGNEAGNNDSTALDISADGRYVVFQSTATNLVSGDSNGQSDIFVRDTQGNTTARVSTDSLGAQATSWSYDPVVSADGRYVAFYSSATNLVSPDAEGFTDVFVKDRQSGETRRVSVAGASTGANNNCFSPDISADGRYVVFYSSASNLGATADANGLDDVFIRDTISNTTDRVSSVPGGASPGNGASRFPSISADGRYVAFQSESTNLVSGDTNLRTDVFIKDTTTGIITRLSVEPVGGVQGNGSSSVPSITADGGALAFESDASNLRPGDTNGVKDIFLGSAGHTYYFPWYDNNPANGMQGNWVMLNNEDSTAATVDIYIGATKLASGLTVPPGSAYAWTAPDVRTSGPVKVVSRYGQKLGVSQRVLYRDSFNEVEGIKSTDLKNEYYFPWYDNNAAGGMNGDWVMVANAGDAATSVSIYVEDMTTPKASGLQLGVGGVLTWRSPDVITGPVKVVGGNSSDRLVVSQRVLFRNSFNEAFGIPTATLAGEAWFTWYDNDPRNNMGGNWVCIANVGGSNANVDIFLNGGLAADNLQVSGNGGHVEWQNPEWYTRGPVQVRSSQPGDKLVISQRVIYKDSFEETAPTYLSQMGLDADFTWYDNNPANGMGGNWVMVANSGAYDQVDIAIGGTPVVTGLGVNGSWGWANWTSTPLVRTGGPLRVTNQAVGNNKLVISQRVIYKNSFNELVGRPR